MKTCKKISTGEIFEYQLFIDIYTNIVHIKLKEIGKEIGKYWYDSVWCNEEEFYNKYIDIKEERKLKLNKIYGNI